MMLIEKNPLTKISFHHRYHAGFFGEKLGLWLVRGVNGLTLASLYCREVQNA